MLEPNKFFEPPKGMMQISRPTLIEIDIPAGDSGFERDGVIFNMAPRNCVTRVAVDLNKGTITVTPGVLYTVTLRAEGGHREKHRLGLKPRRPEQNYLNLRKGKW